YEKAEEFLQKGLDARLKIQSPLEIVLSQIELARLFKRTGRVNESIELATNALELSKEIPFLKGEMIASEILATGFEQKENYKEADRKSTRLNSSHVKISYAVFCLKKKKDKHHSSCTS